MKKPGLMLPLFVLAFAACEKSQETVRYTDYYVRSPKTQSELITIEEYNKMMASTQEKEIDRGRNWVECFYKDGETWKKGKTCTTTTTQGCSEAEGCRGGKYLP